jgi:hypothetical protein
MLKNIINYLYLRNKVTYFLKNNIKFVLKKGLRNIKYIKNIKIIIYFYKHN